MRKIIRPGGVVLALFFVLALASFGQNAPAHVLITTLAGRAATQVATAEFGQGYVARKYDLEPDAAGRQGGEGG